MKKLIYISVLSLGLLSCDDFLDEKLTGSFNGDKLYENIDMVELAVNGVYNGAAYSINLWKFGDVASDDAVKGGNPGDQASLNEIENFEGKSDNGTIAEFWQNTYETIARANNVIAGVPGVSGDAAIKNRYIAEAKFFRAYSYFQLVNLFGQVPLKLYPQTKSENIHVPLSSVSAIYTQIEKDLTEAAPALSIKYGSEDQGRVTRGAAYGLLAKVRLYQGKYSDALQSIQDLEDLNIYDLDSYENLFKLGNENSKEAIFAIRFKSDETPAFGNSLNQWLAPLDEGGYYFDAPTQDYVDCFDEKQTDGSDDLRLDISIGRDGMPWLNGDYFSSSWSTATGYLVKKHNQPLSEVPAGRKGDGGLAYIYLRYADILLMKAECLNETHRPELAEIELSTVRNRAGLASVSGESESALRDLIRKERRRELGFEFHRFFDLMRYGKEVATAALGSRFKWQEPRFYFPLPQTELDTNTALK